MADPVQQWAQLLRSAVTLAPPGVSQEALDLVQQAASAFMADADSSEGESEEGSEAEEGSKSEECVPEAWQ